MSRESKFQFLAQTGGSLRFAMFPRPELTTKKETTPC